MKLLVLLLGEGAQNTDSPRLVSQFQERRDLVPAPLSKTVHCRILTVPPGTEFGNGGSACVSTCERAPKTCMTGQGKAAQSFVLARTGCSQLPDATFILAPSIDAYDACFRKLASWPENRPRRMPHVVRRERSCETTCRFNVVAAFFRCSSVSMGMQAMKKEKRKAREMKLEDWQMRHGMFV